MMPTIADTPNEPHNRIDQLHDLLQVALDVIRNGVAISDMRQPDCPLIYVNNGFEELTGYTAQEVIGRNCRFLQGAERDQEALSRLREALSQGEPCCVILRNYRKDGTAFWNELSLHPLFDKQGELSHFVGIQHDISAIIERSKYLIQSERNSAHEAARHASSMTSLNEMSRQLNFALQEEALYQIIIDHTPQILHADYISIALRTPQQQQVVIVAHSSAPAFLVQDTYLPITASAIERVMLNKQLLIENSNESEMSGTGMGSHMHAPLITGADTIGALTVACQQPNAFSQRDEHLLLQVASLLASHLQNRRLFAQTQAALEQAKEYAHRLALLNTMGQQMGGAADETAIFQLVTQFALQIVPSARASIALMSEDQRHIEVFALQGSTDLLAVGVRIPIQQTLVGTVIASRQLLYIPDLRLREEVDAQRLVQDGIRAGVIAPITVDDQVIGTLNVSRKLVAAYQEQDLSLVQQITTFLGKTIENTRLYHAAREHNTALVQTLEQLHETQAQLLAAEKMASLGRLVAGLAHEINTPIGVAVTAASIWEDRVRELGQLYQRGEMTRADFEGFLHTITESGKLTSNNLNRAATLIQNFKQVAVDQSSEAARDINLKHYIIDVIATLRPELKRTNLEVEVTGDEELILKSYPGALSQIITNLVINSVTHAYEPETSGRLTITIKRQNNKAYLYYADDGKGIPPEHQGKIFEPFFTTRRGQGGSGLGLHIVYNIVTQKLGGAIRFQSQVGVGTTFTITLPLPTDYSPTAPLSVTGGPAASN